MNRICSCVAYWFNPFYSACNATEQFKDLSCQRKIAVVFATAIVSPLLAFVGTAGFFRFFTTRFSPSATNR